MSFFFESPDAAGILAALCQDSPAKGVFSGVTRTLAQASVRPLPAQHSKKRPAERRGTVRQAATGSVLVNPGCEGRLLDWSSGGFAVESNLALRVGALYHPRWRVGDELRLMAGIVRWSRLSHTVAKANGDVAPVFRSGFELVELPPSEPSRHTGVS